MNQFFNPYNFNFSKKQSKEGIIAELEKQLELSYDPVSMALEELKLISQDELETLLVGFPEEVKTNIYDLVAMTEDCAGLEDFIEKLPEEISIPFVELTPEYTMTYYHLTEETFWLNLHFLMFDVLWRNVKKYAETVL